MTYDAASGLLAEIAAAPKKINEDALARLSEMARRADELAAGIEADEAALNERKQALWKIRTRDMIDLMDEARVEQVVVDGKRYTAQTEYKAAIPKEHAEEAFAWLEADGSGDIVKQTVLVTFPRDAEEKTAELAEYLRNRYQDASVENKKEVPWKRLTSWFKEQVSDLSRTDIPLEILGARTDRVVAIKTVKEK